MKFKNIIWVMMFTVIIMLFGGCEANPSVQLTDDLSTENKENVVITYETLMYDNAGNNYVTFKGNKFNIRPNKIKQWGYNTGCTDTCELYFIGLPP